MLRAARALILLRCVPWCVAYWPACSCSHVSQQGSMDCAPPPPPPHLTVDTDKCMKMYETQTSEPEKQTGEMESGEVKNSTTDKVIVKPDNLRSTVWRFFGFWSVGGKVGDKSKAVCKLCDAELAYHSTTTNLRMHLIVVHPTEWNKVGEDEADGPLPKQPKLTVFYSPTTSLPAAKQEAITKKLTEFICKDMRPISIVDGVGFQKFIHEINPRYQVPSRGTVNNRIVKLN